MQEAARNTYLKQLKEIKERGKVFSAFSRGDKDAIFERATVEVAVLQLRAIADLLAFGFVLAIGEDAVRYYADFVKYRNAEEFINRLDELSSHFYPKPILQKRNANGEMEWINLSSSEYLSREDFCILIEHCDRVLWPRRLGPANLSLAEYKAANKKWYGKIVRLLNSHLIHSEDEGLAYLFQMNANDSDPECVLFRCVSRGERRMPSLSHRKRKRPAEMTLQEHLSRQMQYLQRSCALYDSGHKDESLRIAVTIRVLFHDTAKSRSLIRQMKVKDIIRVVTSFEDLPKDFQPVAMYPLFANSADGGTSVPFALPSPALLLSVDDWWSQLVWMQPTPMSRKDIVLAAANKDGGAHVEGISSVKIKELRQGLTHITSMKVNGVEMGVPSNYHFVLLRQFAHELLNSQELQGLTRAAT
ncbi:MAG: hypothetical protein AB7I35_05275 [Ramlibacter sp.]